MTLKNISHTELSALRKSAPHNIKLTVSRPARNYRKPVTYTGTGNLLGYVKRVTGITDPARLRPVMARVNAVVDYTGVTPDAVTILTYL